MGLITKENLREMFPYKNLDELPYKTNKTYTWEYMDYETPSGKPKKKQRKFRVRKTYYNNKYQCKMCIIEYIAGDCKGEVYHIPLVDMPVTLEKR